MWREKKETPSYLFLSLTLPSLSHPSTHHTTHSWNVRMAHEKMKHKLVPQTDCSVILGIQLCIQILDQLMQLGQRSRAPILILGRMSQVDSHPMLVSSLICFSRRHHTKPITQSQVKLPNCPQQSNVTDNLQPSSCKQPTVTQLAQHCQQALNKANTPPQ